MDETIENTDVRNDDAAGKNQENRTREALGLHSSARMVGYTTSKTLSLFAKVLESEVRFSWPDDDVRFFSKMACQCRFDPPGISDRFPAKKFVVSQFADFLKTDEVCRSIVSTIVEIRGRKCAKDVITDAISACKSREFFETETHERELLRDFRETSIPETGAKILSQRYLRKRYAKPTEILAMKNSFAFLRSSVKVADANEPRVGDPLLALKFLRSTKARDAISSSGPVVEMRLPFALGKPGEFKNVGFELWTMAFFANEMRFFEFKRNVRDCPSAYLQDHQKTKLLEIANHVALACLLARTTSRTAIAVAKKSDVLSTRGKDSTKNRFRAVTNADRVEEPSNALFETVNRYDRDFLISCAYDFQTLLEKFDVAKPPEEADTRRKKKQRLSEKNLFVMSADSYLSHLNDRLKTGIPEGDRGFLRFAAGTDASLDVKTFESLKLRKFLGFSFINGEYSMKGYDGEVSSANDQR
jgi:hypothetical protein